MDRMSALDAGFFYAESENTPMHVGSVAVFDGPAPTYGDVVRLLLSKLPLVPRYRQRVRPVPMQLGRPVWVDDPHFQILYHVRHTAVPGPGSDEQLRNLAGRVLGQRLDMAKPLWELWLVEGLRRRPLGDHLQGPPLHGRRRRRHRPHAADVRPRARRHARGAEGLDAAAHPVVPVAGGRRRHRRGGPPARSSSSSMPTVEQRRARRRRASPSRARPLAQTVPSLAKQAITPTARSLNGPIGPHRRWAWTEGKFEEFKAVRTALGGTVNDVVLTAITGGFRDLLAGPRRAVLGEARRPLDGAGVGPASPTRRAALNNQVSAVFVDLPVGLPDPVDRLTAIRGQMDEYKKTMAAVDANSIIAMGNYVAPTLLSLGVRAALQAGQMWCQAVTTNVPGPRFPLYVLGRRMTHRHRLRADRRRHPLLDRHLLLPEHDDVRDQRRLRRLPRHRRPLRRHPARHRGAARPREQAVRRPAGQRAAKRGQAASPPRRPPRGRR